MKDCLLTPGEPVVKSVPLTSLLTMSQLLFTSVSQKISKTIKFISSCFQIPLNPVLTKQCDLLCDAIDVYDGPEWTADAEPTVEKDGLSFINAVKDSSMAVSPERQNIILQGQSFREGFGPVARPGHQVWTGVLWDVCGNQFAWVQTGETKAQRSTPASVHTTQAKTHLDQHHWKTLDL